MPFLQSADGHNFSDISATPAPFSLLGGYYQFAVVATWNSSGTVTLEQLGPDGSTYLTVGTAVSANGFVNEYLPPGEYKLVVATATAVYATLVRIPLGA